MIDHTISGWAADPETRQLSYHAGDGRWGRLLAGTHLVEYFYFANKVYEQDLKSCGIAEGIEAVRKIYASYIGKERNGGYGQV